MQSGAEPPRGRLGSERGSWSPPLWTHPCAEYTLLTRPYVPSAEVATTGQDEITVSSESSGEGRTAGRAAVSQEAVAEADIDVLRLSKILLQNGREVAVVEEEGTGTANSRSEHEADSERGGEFVFEQNSNTTIEQAIGLAKSG